MEWSKRGRMIAGVHLGAGYAGTVTKSRIDSEGWIYHTVDLFEPIVVQGRKLLKIEVIDEHQRMSLG